MRPILNLNLFLSYCPPLLLPPPLPLALLFFTIVAILFVNPAEDDGMNQKKKPFLLYFHSRLYVCRHTMGDIL